MTPLQSPTRNFYGKVQIDGRGLGEHFCELRADAYQPREMQLVIHLQGDESTGLWRTGLSQSARVEGPGVEVLTREGMGLHIGSSGARVTARVERVVTTSYWFSDDSAPTYSFGYSFPLTAVTQIHGVRVLDAYAGLIRSQDGIKEEDGSHKFEPVKLIEVTLDGIDIEIGSAFDFAEGGTTRYPEETLTRVSTLSFTVQQDPSDAPPLDLARGVADASLRLLSVLERDRIQWVTEGWYATGTKEEPLRQRKTVRWTSPPRDRSRLRPTSDTHEEALKTLIQAYDRLGSFERAAADLMCSQFEIASTSGDLETALLRWHSVIDFACKRSETARNVEKRPSPMKRRITQTCLAMGVDLGGTVPEAELEKPNKGTFSFTDLRNQFVHDGFDVFEGRHHELIDGLHTARAVAERMLLATLGVDAPLSYLGTTGGPH